MQMAEKEVFSFFHSLFFHSSIVTEVVEQRGRAVALQAEGWVFEFHS